MDLENTPKVNSNLKRFKSILKSNAIVILVLIGAALGFAIGFGLRGETLSEDAITWIGMPGDIFMRMLKMTILPFVVSCIIYETASLDPKANGKLGGMALAFFVINNLLGGLFAPAMYMIFKPGEQLLTIRNDTERTGPPPLQPQDLVADLIRNIFPDNLVSACFEKDITKYKEDERINMTVTYKRAVEKTPATNLIGLILVSFVFGIAISLAKEHGKPFLELMRSIMEVMTLILRWIIWTTPIGVLSLIATSIAIVEDIEKTFRVLAAFIGTYTLGLVFHILFIIPLVYFLVKRKNPLRFLLSAVRPLMVVVAPPASVLGIPEMIKTCEEKHDVDRRVSRFVIPLGATISRIGSCFFICMSTMLLLNMDGVRLEGIQIFLIVLLGFLGSLALPSIPSGSIYTIIVVLTSLNMSTKNIGILMALEWYTDRLRSISNALTIILGTVILDKFCKNPLTSDEETENNSKQDGDSKVTEDESL